MCRPRLGRDRRALTLTGVLAVVLLGGCTSTHGGDPSAATPTRPTHQRVMSGTVLKLSAAAIERRRIARQIAAEKARLRKIARQNPLAHHPWGTYMGPLEKAWGPYADAHGDTKRQLGVIANQPKAAWFGAWVSDDSIGQHVRDYIAGSQHGNKNALVQMALFRMQPWEDAACGRLPSGREAASYKRWIDNFADAVGGTPTAIILQPDGPFALCAPGRTPSDLISYASQRLSALPRTSVYIDAGAGDWPAAGRQGGVDAAVKILLDGGVKHARGFALNSTHYSATPIEVERGAAIAKALAAHGLRGKKFVVNTTSNGHPFAFGDYHGGDPDDARVCRSLSANDTCIALGIPPTTKVADPRWRLPAATNKLAAEYCDAYMWFGRPWLHRQADPFKMDRALALAHTWQY